MRRRFPTLVIGVVWWLLSGGSLALAASSPTIESESASAITTNDAKLEAAVNLNEAAAGVYYQFQVVENTDEYAPEILCPPTLQPGYTGCVGPQGSGALPIGFLPGNTMQPSATSHARLDLASAGLILAPATTYHYRVLVARRVPTEDRIEWEEPTVFGHDGTFTTLPEPTGEASQLQSSQLQPATSTPSWTPSVASAKNYASRRRHRGRRRHYHRRTNGIHRVKLHRAIRVASPYP